MFEHRRNVLYGSGTTRIDVQRDKLMESEEKHAGFRMRRDVFF